MTSGDTHALTVELLEQNEYYGYGKENITIVKQEKVPALLGIDAEFALEEDQFLILTKPHGHGDVHTLLHMHGVVEKWKHLGKKWIMFFQDTNPLVFKCAPSFLGVSALKDFDVLFYFCRIVFFS